MKNNPLISPFLKWVGGKRQLLPAIIKVLPKDIRKRVYYEPFIGGGALFFKIQPKNAIINDFNEELINVYITIRDKTEELLESLSHHKNNPEYYYYLRNLDRDNKLFSTLSDVERASRIIYLNKTCYNGLYRVNNAGEFNVPYGGYKNPNIINAPILKAVSKYLKSNNITILCGDYSTALENADTNSFAYLDPPYQPLSSGNNFTGYIRGGWEESDQIRLKRTCDELNNRGVKFLLSNSDCEFIRNLYMDYSISAVKAIRSINSDGSGRGAINELLIKNY